MRLVAVAGILVAGAGVLHVAPARQQGVTVPVKPSDQSIRLDVIYPDAVICDVNSPQGIDYQVFFYKSQVISFSDQKDNVADCGATFAGALDKPDQAVATMWRLQLGQPGNITMFALPAGWTTPNCAVGKSIADLKADGQALKLFRPE